MHVETLICPACTHVRRVYTQASDLPAGSTYLVRSIQSMVIGFRVSIWVLTGRQNRLGERVIEAVEYLR